MERQSRGIALLWHVSHAESEEQDVWFNRGKTPAANARRQDKNVLLRMMINEESKLSKVSGGNIQLIQRYPRPVSKAYVNLLQDRINQLEAALQDKGEQDKTTINDSTGSQELPETSRVSATHEVQTDVRDFAVPNVPSIPPQEPNFTNHRSFSDRGSETPSESSLGRNSGANKKSPTVHKLLSTRGHLSFDQIAGQLRYFGPTTNCHIYSEINAETEENRRRAKEQERRTSRILSTLSQSTHDYLMEMYWEYYNSVVHVIDRDAFEEGRAAGGGPFYSGFLHICVLAAGYRFADKQRQDMLSIFLSSRESTLHREAKYMLDYEMERPGGIPSIGALLILGDLEVGCGRDNVGWLYSGMACRLCFDAGLHLDRSQSGISQKDIEIGRITLWACVLYDRYWALFLGRPTAMKPDDLEVYDLSEKFDRLGTCNSAGEERNQETQIYQALIELMELAAKITEFMDKVSNKGSSIDRLVYVRMSALDRELEKLYARLPPSLQYTAENVKTAPFSFFLFHQQYYSATILLHRQFARYDDLMDSPDEEGLGYRDSVAAASHQSTLSRATCTSCAGRIAQIFWQHRQRFDTRKIFCTGLQHAGNAATALVAAIASSDDRIANDKNMRYLECLTAALKDMAESYQPAERMASVLDAVLHELQGIHPEHHVSSLVPARRGSSADPKDASGFMPSKRNSTNRHRQSISSLNMMPFQEHDARPTSNTLLPSPDSSSQTRSDKQTSYGMSADDFVVVDSDMPNLDGAWPIFNGSDPFAMEDGIANHASSSTFRSMWSGADTPVFNLGSLDSANRNFMALLEDTDRTGQGIDITSPDKNRASPPVANLSSSMPGTGESPQGTVCCSEIESSSGNDRTRGYQSSSEKSVSDTRYASGMARPESNIWTEIIS